MKRKSERKWKRKRWKKMNSDIAILYQQIADLKKELLKLLLEIQEQIQNKKQNDV